ncbi:MAG: phosphagen kinase [Waddliaceae bacterium]
MYFQLVNFKKYLINISLALLLCVGVANTAYAQPSAIETFLSLKESQKTALKKEKTKFGVTLEHVLKSGMENPDSKIGCYAGDAESYATYSPIFSDVIKKYHDYSPNAQNTAGQEKKDFHFTKEDQDTISGHVVSTRIRVARNLSSFPFPSSMTKDQRQKVESVVLEAIKNLPQEYQGKYYSISSLSNEEYEKLVEDHLLFKGNDKYLKSSGIFDDWPEGRGAHISNDKKFMIWINEEDQLRIVYLENSANFEKIYNAFTDALNRLEENLTFAHDDKLGYLNSCPTNIGTAMRASVHLKLNAIDPKKVESIAKKHQLSVRGTHGEHSNVLQGVYDVSNSRRLGSNIETLLSNLVKGIVALVNEDQKLSSQNITTSSSESAAPSLASRASR